MVIWKWVNLVFSNITIHQNIWSMIIFNGGHSSDTVLLYSVFFCLALGLKLRNQEKGFGGLDD